MHENKIEENDAWGENIRDIKFRAWDINELKMIDADSFYFSDEFEPFVDSVRSAQKQFEIMQFIDLKDKNGIEVYEGDIIKSGYTDYLYVICFEGRYVGNAISTPQTHISDVSKITMNYYDVVGNIYENPELLQKDA